MAKMMNTYNKLFILEDTKLPVKFYNSKIWYLNLSKNKYFYKHRKFHLPAAIYYFNNKS